MEQRYTNRLLLTTLFSGILVLILGTVRPEPISSVTQKEKFWADKVHSKKKYQVIFSGDSRLYRGIDVQTVSDKLNGVSVLNFGFSSGGHNSVIFKEISNRLDKESKPNAIVLVLTPYSLTPKAQENSHFLQEKNRDEKEVFSKRYLNPFLEFFDPIKPSEIMYSNLDLPGYYERFEKDGWVRSWKIPTNKKEALKSYSKNFDGNQVQSKIVQEVCQQTKKWIEQGINVFVFRIPSSPEMEVLEDQLSGYKENQVKSAFEKVGSTWITIGENMKYNSYDGSHLDGESAIRFSSYIGQELKKVLKN